VAPIFRLYSELLKEHLFTVDENEMETLAGAPENIWKYEGVAFYVNPTDTGGLLPVYRLYNAKIKNHLLTTDANEKDWLSAKPGWVFEGVAYYVDAAGD